MAKVNIKSEEITPFGGIYYASKAFCALSLDKVFNGTLGVRSSTYNGYQWDEIMSAMSDVFVCGGDCFFDGQLPDFLHLFTDISDYLMNYVGQTAYHHLSHQAIPTSPHLW